MPNPYDESQNRTNKTRTTQKQYTVSENGQTRSYTETTTTSAPRTIGNGGNAGNNGQYRKGDAPNQIPWWVIVLLFCVGGWPISVILILINQFIKTGTLDFSGRRNAANRNVTHPVYTDVNRRNAYTSQGAAQGAARGAGGMPPQTANAAKAKDTATAENVLTILGIVFAALGAIAMLATLGEAGAVIAGGSSILSLFEDITGAGIFLAGGLGMLFGAGKLKTSRRMRKKIENVVGDSDYMYIRDIADAVSCSYEKCCGHLENCIDKGVFGEGAYLDMRTACLVVRGKAPAQAKEAARQTAEKAASKGNSKYTDILNQLRRVNDAIPDAGMTDKITRLEKVSAKIFKQAEDNPDKLPQMRKFMDYYLPTSLKLLQTYAELEAQGIEGDNIRESKQRIEQSMDTLVVAFENQLDQLFKDDALDVSTDIDVMENMLRADGLSGGDDPFGLYGGAPSAPEPPENK